MNRPPNLQQGYTPRHSNNANHILSQAHAIKTISRQATWIYVILGMQLIGILVIMVLISWFIIRRGITPPVPNTYAKQVVPNTPNPLNPTKMQPTMAPQVVICTASQGTVMDKTFYSASAQDNIPYRVYLPPCYAQNNRRYP